MKKCSHCGRVLDESHFSHYSRAKDGLRSWCRDCCNAYAKQYALRQKRTESEKHIAKTITNNKVDNIFCVNNIKDIPLNIRKQLKFPKKLIEDKTSSFTIKSRLSNVLRRSQDTVHCSQIQVAYYRMYNEFIKSRPLTIHLNNMKRNDPNILNPMKGYYAYKQGE